MVYDSATAAGGYTVLLPRARPPPGAVRLACAELGVPFEELDATRRAIEPALHSAPALAGVPIAAAGREWATAGSSSSSCATRPNSWRALVFNTTVTDIDRAQPATFHVAGASSSAALRRRRAVRRRRLGKSAAAAGPAPAPLRPIYGLILDQRPRCPARWHGAAA